MYNYFFENIEKELSLADFFTLYCDSSLFLLSSDYAIVVVTTEELSKFLLE